MNRIERRISRITALEQDVHARMVEQALDPVEMARLGDQLRGLEAEREALETDWLEAAEHAG